MMPTCRAGQQATPGDSSQPEATTHFCPCGPHIFTLPSCQSFLPFCVPPILGHLHFLYCMVSSYAFPSSGSDKSVLPAPDLQCAVYPHPSLIQTPKAPNRQGIHLILAVLDAPQHRRDNYRVTERIKGRSATCTLVPGTAGITRPYLRSNRPVCQAVCSLVALLSATT